jgi:hypothetical protein
MMSGKSKVRRNVGDVVAIPLGDGTYGFGRVLLEPLMAFYDLKEGNIPDLEKIIAAPTAFVVYVMNHAVTDGSWPVVGSASLDENLLVEPLFFKKDRISQRLSIYRDSTGEETPATPEQCEQLECAAVWEPAHIIDRLIDHFAGRRNKWVESLRP